VWGGGGVWGGVWGGGPPEEFFEGKKAKEGRKRSFLAVRRRRSNPPFARARPAAAFTLFLCVCVCVCVCGGWGGGRKKEVGGKMQPRGVVKAG